MTFTQTTNGLQQTDKRHQMILHVKVKALQGDKSRTRDTMSAFNFQPFLT